MKWIAYSCVILIDNEHVKHKKLPIRAVFTWLLTLSKMQDRDQDGNHVS